MAGFRELGVTIAAIQAAVSRSPEPPFFDPHGNRGAVGEAEASLYHVIFTVTRETRSADLGELCSARREPRRRHHDHEGYEGALAHRTSLLRG